jgi:hypothetical protein
MENRIPSPIVDYRQYGKDIDKGQTTPHINIPETKAHIAEEQHFHPQAHDSTFSSHRQNQAEPM